MLGYASPKPLKPFAFEKARQNFQTRRLRASPTMCWEDLERGDSGQAVNSLNSFPTVSQTFTVDSTS